MKKVLLIIASLAMFSCAGSQNEVEKKASGFIEAYLSRNLASVAEMCSPEISALIGEHSAVLDKADSVMSEKIDSVLKTYSYSIEDCLVSGDSAEVRYHIIRGKDTLPSDKIVRLVKEENGWMIIALK